jgi:hypothetical protein
MRAYATQVETLRRLRNGGSQVVRVEHLHVNDGGQAVIGNVRSGTAGEGHPSSRMSNEIDDDRDERASRMTRSEILAEVEAMIFARCK